MPYLQVLAGCVPRTSHRCGSSSLVTGNWVSYNLMVTFFVFSEKKKKNQARHFGRQADDRNKRFLWWDYFNLPV